MVKRFFGLLALIMLISVCLSAITLSLLVIWGGVDPVLGHQIEDTIWLGAIVMIVSFIINCGLE
jgi:divalent metal cation (Fe/Co/Zn/Cd) transporter